MANQLLVRLYNVDLGDFIYLRVPDTSRDVHILIDCGTLSKLGVLTDHLESLKQELPLDANGKRQLDLLVVSHPHEDHHKGFIQEHFQDISIQNLWLSPAYDRHNPKAVGFFALKDAAVRALTSLSAFVSGQLKLEVDAILDMTKSDIIQYLCRGMDQGITPLFASADTPPEDLKIFEDGDIKLKVISPMSNIDGYYLGAKGLDLSVDPQALTLSLAGEDLSMAQTQMLGAIMQQGYASLYQTEVNTQPNVPENLSVMDFEKLRSRLSSNVLALAEMTGKIENNLSLVILLEWHGKRLLFTGDAEWSTSYKGAVKAGSCNGSWNVMWAKRKADLSQPLDFLKVGHHGSENATPWTPKKENKPEHPINQILEAMLPLDHADDALAVVSTKRTNQYPSIPNRELLEELARRVKNVETNYLETSTSPKAIPANISQPTRTDLELDNTGHQLPFIEVYFDQ